MGDEQLEVLGATVLGIGWSNEKDKFIFKITINVSKRKRNQPTGGRPDPGHHPTVGGGHAVEENLPVGGQFYL